MPRRYNEDEDPGCDEEEGQEEEQEELPEQEGDDGDEDQVDWAYSTCEGNKKAVLVGIKYTGSASPLDGCHNDANRMHEFITENYGYGDGEDDIKILLDDDEDPETQPTRANIIDALNWLVEGASQNDALFFYYSGHGGSVEDTDGDEVDGTDETICPIDSQSAGQITDDELHSILVKPLPIGCRLTVIFDCCHSGSALDLPYTYGADGEIEEKQSDDHTAFALEHAAKAHSEGNMGALTLAARQMSLAAAGGVAAAESKTKKTRTHPADVIFLSGCQDIQLSVDGAVEGKATGALSHALLTSLADNPEPTYQELLVSIREFLAAGEMDQLPQLSSSHPMDTSLTFII